MMEICSDWTSDSVQSTTKLETCNWSDETSLGQLSVSQKQMYRVKCAEEREEANIWDKVEWSMLCSSVEDLFAQSWYNKQKSSADSSANQDVYALSVCSMNPSLKPGSSKADQSKTPAREIDPNVYIGIRRSPRFIRYQKISLDSFSSSFTEQKWQLFSVVELNGCAEITLQMFMGYQNLMCYRHIQDFAPNCPIKKSKDGYLIISQLIAL